MKRAKTIPYVSLFSGAGGLDAGFDRAGFVPELAVDGDAAAVRTFNARFGEVAVQRELCPPGMAELDPLLDDITGVPRGLVGGPPCQGFSRGNARSDSSDPRNLLLQGYVEAAKNLSERFKIDFFVLENVPGLRQRHHAELLAEVKADLARVGFAVFEGRLDAASFGVPQRRERLFLVGFRKELGVRSFDWPKGCGSSSTVRDAIHGLPEPTFFRRGLKPSEIETHPNHWTMNVRSPKFAARDFARHRDGRSFRLLEWDEQSGTVAYGNREIHVHPDGKRRLSIYEAMLLQGFPKDYQLMGNLSEQVQQVSNAVPPPLAEAVAHQVRQHLEAATSEAARRPRRPRPHRLNTGGGAAARAKAVLS